MAKHKREYYTCDICECEIDKPYNGGERGTFRLKANSDFAVTGCSWGWDDLCQSCNEWLGGHISDLEHFAKEMKKARKEASHE